MRRAGRLYVDMRQPVSIVRINRVILCGGEDQTDLYEVTDILNCFHYTVDGEVLSHMPISDLAVMEWLKSP